MTFYIELELDSCILISPLCLNQVIANPKSTCLLSIYLLFMHFLFFSFYFPPSTSWGFFQHFQVICTIEISSQISTLNSFDTLRMHLTQLVWLLLHVYTVCTVYVLHPIFCLNYWSTVRVTTFRCIFQILCLAQPSYNVPYFFFTSFPTPVFFTTAL